MNDTSLGNNMTMGMRQCLECGGELVMGRDVARARSLDGLPFDRKKVPGEVCYTGVMLPVAAR